MPYGEQPAPRSWQQPAVIPSAAGMVPDGIGVGRGFRPGAAASLERLHTRRRLRPARVAHHPVQAQQVPRRHLQQRRLVVVAGLRAARAITVGGDQVTPASADRYSTEEVGAPGSSAPEAGSSRVPSCSRSGGAQAAMWSPTSRTFSMRQRQAVVVAPAPQRPHPVRRSKAAQRGSPGREPDTGSCRASAGAASGSHRPPRLRSPN